MVPLWRSGSWSPRTASILREGLQELLRSSPGIEVVAACADVDSLLEAVEEHEPEVVLTDIRMPPSGSDEGIQVAASLRESHPEIGVVVLSQFSEPTYVLKLLESGSDGRGYLLKDRVHNRGELVSAIDAVARGGSVIDPKIVEVLVEAKARAESLAAVPADTARGGGARRDGTGEEQHGDRRVARAHEARRREAHQLHLHEARPRRFR